MNLNHLLVAALAFIVAGTWIYTTISNNQHRAKLATANTMASHDRSPVYTTIQLKMQGKGREITLKGVFESVDAERCLKDLQKTSSLVGNYQQRCNSEESCNSLKLSSCSSYVEQSYKDMLNKQPASTRYLHLQNSQNHKERGVLVFWGLNSTEADDFCSHMKKERVPAQIEMACI